MWFVPTIYLVVAVIAGQVGPAYDRRHPDLGSLVRDADSVRQVLAATATGMLSFTGFVVTMTLLVVQMSSTSFGPRLIRWARRDAIVKHSLGIFVATFTFALLGLAHVEAGDEDEFVPTVTYLVTIAMLLTSVGMFLALVERITISMRPASVAQRLARQTSRLLDATFPGSAGEIDELMARAAALPDRAEVRFRGRCGGTIQALVERDLRRYADHTGGFVELVPAVGEHVHHGSLLYLVHGELPSAERARLERSVVIGDERTVDHDPAFAIRLMVDIANRALSPAVNDPTTAVQVIDWLQSLLEDAASKRLGYGVVRGSRGAVAAVFRSSTWDDLVTLAFEEILYYGRDSVQVNRRLAAALASLILTVPTARRPTLGHMRERLAASTAEHFVLRGSRAVATVPDPLGLGPSRPR